MPPHATGVCPSTADDDFTLNVPQLIHLVADGHLGGRWLLASMSLVFLQTFLYVSLVQVCSHFCWDYA